MPLNYSKWDALEVSDDSDIEGHPNVDHKSLVRWKQRDIHEKREARKQRIAEYKSIIALNVVLIPRAEAVLKDVADGGPEKYSQIVERLRTQPSDDKPPGGQQTYDSMICQMLLKIKDELKEKGIDKPDTDQLVKGIKEHIDKMYKIDKDSKDALADEEREQKKKITSDDIHEGFSSTSVMKELPPEPTNRPKKTTKTTESSIEVLNPGAKPAPLPVAASTSEAADADDEDEDERIPELTPTLIEFTKIPVGDFEKSYKFIQEHAREIMRAGAYDELVIAGFRAAVRNDLKYAKQCVHQGLIVQYCEKLGRDGVGLFFQRMFSGNKTARQVFEKDYLDTYNMMLSRAAKAREDDQKERIQLVAEDPSQTISFNVPDGPPPAEIRLEGPGTENLDPAEVREALQRRWEIFEGFNPELQNALKGGKLDDVNDVLGDMDVEEAENVVKLLEIAGILSFSRQGIVDETGKAPQPSDDD